jgi:hypothetical protein
MRKNKKIGDLSGFDGGQIVGAHLPGACMTKSDTLLGILRVPVSMVVSIHKSWEDYINKEEQWAKINIDRKETVIQ